MQSMKEMGQFLNSLKSSIETHKNEIEAILKETGDGDDNNKEAIVAIKTSEIRRLTTVLQEALRYSKFYQDLDTGKFEILLNECEFEEEEQFTYDDSDCDFSDYENE